jgi:hypothetical protein
MKKQLLGKGAWIAAAAMTMLAFISCSSPADSGSSGENRVLTFTVSGAETEIAETNSRITIFYPAGTVITGLAPVITVSDKATVSPASLAPQDFTEPVVYTVTAESGATRTYTARAVALPADLSAAVSEAEDVKSGIVTASSAGDVPEGTEWVSQAALDALNGMIAKAESVAEKADATDAEKAEAIRELAKAIVDFENAKQTGTKTGTEAADKTALSAAVAGANDAKGGVVVNTAAEYVPVGTRWVTQAAMDALNGAIGTAETVSTNANATQAQVDAAVSPLTTATTAFNEAKQDGTFVAVTSISFTEVSANGTSGFPVSLAGAAVEPNNATNKTIVWTVKTADAGAVSGNSFTPATSVAAGSQVELRATIADVSAPGTAYSAVHTITVNAPGTTTPEVGFGDDTSIRLLGNGSSLLSRDTPVDVSLNAAYYVSLVGSYIDIFWYLNGSEQTVKDNRIYLDTLTAKTIKLAVIATKDGKVEGSGTYTFVIGQPGN